MNMIRALAHHACRVVRVAILAIGYTLAWLAYLVLGAVFGYGLESGD